MSKLYLHTLAVEGDADFSIDDCMEREARSSRETLRHHTPPTMSPGAHIAHTMKASPKAPSPPRPSISLPHTGVCAAAPRAAPEPVTFVFTGDRQRGLAGRHRQEGL
eukprot:1580610-Prymnesium_polylepis.2